MPPWYLAAERETVKYSYKTVTIHEQWNREDVTNNSYIIKFMKKVFLHILQMPQNNETELYWIQSEEARNKTNFGWHIQKSMKLKLQYTELFSDL